MNANAINFLSPDLTNIRHSIKGIIDSYNNPWDILAELIQNSVDAIRQRKDCTEKGKIEIELISREREISIRDNGIGIEPTELPNLLKPFSTNKKNVNEAIGEKGVGLKYVIFSSNYFLIESGTSQGSATGIINNARGWKDSTDDEQLILHYEKMPDPMVGTYVKIKDVLNEYLFELTYEQLVYTLRTCTAIGNTYCIWDDDIEIEVLLTYTDINGEERKREPVKNRYFLLPEEIGIQNSIDLNEFIKWDSEDSRTDADRRKKLHDKVLYMKGEYTHSNNRKIKYYAYYLPKRKHWEELTVKLKLAEPERLEDEEWKANYYFTNLSDGIYLSTKGMPTGIAIDHPSTGSSGYWANLFIVFNDDFLKFDIGRKTIQGRQVSIHKNHAKKVFNTFLKYVTKYVSGDISIYEPSDWDKDEIFEEIDGLINIDKPWLKFQKMPTDQEASVAAIFYECIGNARIKGITPLISGYRNKYDLYAKWGSKKVVIEFKSRLSNILKDFKDLKKMFDEINCVVCWDVTSSELQKMYNEQLTIDRIPTGNIFGAPTYFPHATHIMMLSGFQSPIYIIDLKIFIDSELN